MPRELFSLNMQLRSSGTWMEKSNPARLLSEMSFSLTRHLSSLGASGSLWRALTFPVLLKVGFLMVGTLGGDRRGRSGGPWEVSSVASPGVGSALEDPWFRRAMALRAASGAPET
jgi:hypothetical protein